jgi:hypothetical protein
VCSAWQHFFDVSKSKNLTQRRWTNKQQHSKKQQTARPKTFFALSNLVTLFATSFLSLLIELNKRHSPAIICILGTYCYILHSTLLSLSVHLVTLTEPQKEEKSVHFLFSPPLFFIYTFLLHINLAFFTGYFQLAFSLTMNSIIAPFTDNYQNYKCANAHKYTNAHLCTKMHIFVLESVEQREGPVKWHNEAL